MRSLILAAALSGAAMLVAWTPVDAAGGALALVIRTFAPGGKIPARHTCTGEDLSPPLEWSGVPAGTRAFALVCEDPDAPTGMWVHWVLYNLPAESTGLPEGIGHGASLPAGALEGKNSWGRNGYGGPCPPPGKPHHYVFRLYALDAPLSLLAGATKAQVEAALRGHVLAQDEYVGLFGR